MKMNKEKFLKTELGSSLKECITSWDIALDECKNIHGIQKSTSESGKQQIGVKHSGKYTKWQSVNFMELSIISLEQTNILDW